MSNLLITGVPRTTEEEKEFANFDIFDDPQTPFSTFNFKYSHLAFERLSKLTEFNTLLHIDDIKEVIHERVLKKRAVPPRMPCSLKEVNNLRRVSVKNRQRLSRYLSRLESRRSRGRTASDSESTSTEISSPSPVEDDLSKSTSAAMGGFSRNELARQIVTRKGVGRAKTQFTKHIQTQQRMSGLVSPRESDEVDGAEFAPTQRRDLPGRRARGGAFDMESARCNSIDDDELDEQFYSCMDS